MAGMPTREPEQSKCSLNICLIERMNEVLIYPLIITHITRKTESVSFIKVSQMNQTWSLLQNAYCPVE